MVAERKMIDLEDIAGGDVLASELDRHPDGLILRRGGQEIATIVPRNEIDRRLTAIPVYGMDGMAIPNRPVTSETIERIVEIVGSMRNIDSDAMHRFVEDGRRRNIQMQLEDDIADDGQ